MITLIAGTNRRGSQTLAVTLHVKEIYEELGQAADLIDLAELPLGVFHPDAYREKPASFEPFTKKVLESNGLVVVVPEYNGGPPGALKYFIDMLPFPESFEGRPVCFIGLSAGMWGALRPVEQMQQVFGYRNAYLFPRRVFLPGVGNLLDGMRKLKDEEIVNRVRQQAEGFVGFIQSLKRG